MDTRHITRANLATVVNVWSANLREAAPNIPWRFDFGLVQTAQGHAEVSIFTQRWPSIPALFLRWVSWYFEDLFWQHGCQTITILSGVLAHGSCKGLGGPGVLSFFGAPDEEVLIGGLPDDGLVVLRSSKPADIFRDSEGTSGFFVFWGRCRAPSIVTAVQHAMLLDCRFAPSY